MKKIGLIIVFFIAIFISKNVFAVTYKEYKVGDKITYNEIEFYVINNSDKNNDSVTLLKAEPLSLDEVNTYGVGHVNVYTSSQGTADNFNGYGGMAYYTSSTCGYVDGSSVEIGCTTDYDKSEVKYVVDAWATDKFELSDLKEDSTGYSARLITYEDLENNLGYDQETPGASWLNVNSEYTPEWVYGNYVYWTMTPYQDEAVRAGIVWGNGGLDAYNVYYYRWVVRPVITLRKSAIGGIIDDKQNSDVNNKESNQIVEIPNTLKKVSILIVLIGIALIFLAGLILVKKNKIN